MGTDNLHHKRKERRTQSHNRKKAERKPYDMVLIVCEGGKTEPNYFESLRDDLRLSSINVEITGECGSAPISIVEKAIDLYKKNTAYDHVYCIFDKDKHTTYQETLQKITDTRLHKGGKIHAITSVPCFEYWLLLHFNYITKPFSSTGTHSICEQLIKTELDKPDRLPNYQKNSQGIFEKIRNRMDEAIKRAKQIEEYNETIKTDNPSTQVYKLVEYLQDLKNTPKQKL